MPKAMVFGTFDGLHEGHRNFFTQASAYGTLRIVVALDRTVMKVKGRAPLKNETERLNALLDEGFDAVLGDKEDKYAVIELFIPDVICLGYDQQAFTDTLAYELKSRDIEAQIIRLKPFEPETYKSSKLNAHPHRT